MRRIRSGKKHKHLWPRSVYRLKESIYFSACGSNIFICSVEPPFATISREGPIILSASFPKWVVTKSGMRMWALGHMLQLIFGFS